MTRHILRFIFMFSLLHTAVCFGAERSPDQRWDSLMKRSGIHEQLNQLPAQIRESLARAHQQQSTLSDEEFAELTAIMQTSFDPDTMRRDVKLHLQRSMTSSDVDGALRWLESALGQKITALEEAASRPEALAEMQREAPVLQKRSERVALVARLEAAIRAVDAAVSMAENVGVAIAVSMTAHAPAAERPSDEQIKAQIEQQRPALRDAYQSFVLLSLLYAYQSLTDAELKQYIDFAESSIGKKYHSSALGAVNYSTMKGGKKMGDMLGKALSKKRPNIIPTDKGNNLPL